MRKLWYCIYVGTCVICHKQYVVQTTDKFSKRWSSYCSNWNRPNCKNDKDEVALLRHHSVFPGNVHKPPIHEACTVTFVEQPNFHSLNTCEDKCITNLRRKLIFKAWSSPAWNNYCMPSHCAFTCFHFRRQRAGFCFSSVKACQMHALSFGCHRYKTQV